MVIGNLHIVSVGAAPYEADSVLIIDPNAVLTLPVAAKFSSRFPGGTFKSSSASALSSMASFRFVTLAGGAPRVWPVLQISAVCLLAKVLITGIT
jgi:hypothetical protein